MIRGQVNFWPSFGTMPREARSGRAIAIVVEAIARMARSLQIVKRSSCIVAVLLSIERKEETAFGIVLVVRCFPMVGC